MCVWWPPRIATCRPWWPKARSARIFGIAWPSFPSSCRPCAIDRKISRPWPRISPFGPPSDLVCQPAPTPQDVNLLAGYSWPGNVRELAAVIERAAILGDGRRLDVATALGTPASSPPYKAATAGRRLLRPAIKRLAIPHSPLPIPHSQPPTISLLSTPPCGSTLKRPSRAPKAASKVPAAPPNSWASTRTPSAPHAPPQNRLEPIPPPDDAV